MSSRCFRWRARELLSPRGDRATAGPPVAAQAGLGGARRAQAVGDRRQELADGAHVVEAHGAAGRVGPDADRDRTRWQGREQIIKLSVKLGPNEL